MKKSIAVVLIIFISMLSYVVADAADKLPGIVTLKQSENLPQPYPQFDEGFSNGSTEGGLALDQAPMPDAAAVQNALNGLAEQIPGAVGASVVDAVTGEQLGAIGADDLMTPASTMKILTAFSALSELGAESRFATRAALDGSSLYLIGGGDILLAEDKGDHASVTGYAGLGDLARHAAKKLTEKGIVNVDVYVDASLYSGSAYVASLPEVDYSWTMESSPIAINRSLVGDSYQSDPAGHALEVFAQRLSENGIEVHIQGGAVAPQSAADLASVESAPLRIIVDEMLLTSDNALAENLAHYVGAQKNGQGNYEGGAQAVKAIIAEQLPEEQTADISSLIIHDGSGLSPENKITPRILTDILMSIWSCKNECSAVQMGVGMPMAGYDGTLSDRFTASGASGRIHAKTGSLDGVSSLAGYAYTSQGRPLLFAIIANSASGEGAYGFRPAIDDAVSTIAGL